jgi:hypothetical protein
LTARNRRAIEDSITTVSSPLLVTKWYTIEVRSKTKLQANTQYKMPESTIGDVRVRPAYRELAEEERQAMADFKESGATFINACEELKKTDDPEKGRLASIAQTKMEEAVMFAVKAITK